MSLTLSHFDAAEAEIILGKSTPKDMVEALQVIERLKAVHLANLRHTAWSDGRRGDAIVKIPGLTDTLTSLVRRFAACGIVRYEDMTDLHRHASALRKALKTLAPSVQIDTIIGEGYEIVSGFDELYRLLHQGKQPALKAQGFTVKQTAILKHLSLRGSAHVDQIACLQRHMSNIRAELKRQGLSKKITITTHGGEGLYTVDKGRDVLAALVAGDLASERPAKKQTQRVRSSPDLKLVVQAA